MATLEQIKPKQKESAYQYLNSLYYKPFFNKEVKAETGDEMNDFLVTIFRDEKTDEKKLHIQPNPTIQFFVANDDVEINQDYIKQIEIEKTHIEKVQNKHLLQYLCQLQDKYNGTRTDFVKKYYRDGNIRKGTTYEANKFHLFNRVFSSDIDIEDYWKGRFIDTFPNAKRTKLTKSYLDIEVDSININGFPEAEEAKCPINALTVFIEEKNSFFTLLLKNGENEQIEKLEKNKKKFQKKLKKEFGDEFKFNIKFFEEDQELDMIAYYFGIMNLYKPDFCGIWNMNFDMVYILNRIGELSGINAIDRIGNRKYEWFNLCADICSHQDFPDYLKVAQYFKDTRNQKPSERIDTFKCASYTQWFDQLCLYASMRKGMGELENFSLSYVSQVELHDDKLNYTDGGSNIKTLPYDDYEKFVTYNIKDVLLLYKLEKKNNDLGLLYSIADITKTRFNKAMRKTISIKNMNYHFELEQGYVQGNNFNMNFTGTPEEETEKFEGAYVADPNLNGYNGTAINGSKSKYIYDFVIDYDYSALYPSIIRTFNIDSSTQYGRVVFLGEKPTKEYDMGGDFIDNLETQNIIYLANKFLGTPTISDIIGECKKEGLIS